MKRLTLPGTALSVPPLCLGGVPFGHTLDERATFALELCTPDHAIAETDSTFHPGQGFLFTRSFDAMAASNTIRHTCEHLWGDNWLDLVARMTEFAITRD